MMSFNAGQRVSARRSILLAMKCTVAGASLLGIPMAVQAQSADEAQAVPDDPGEGIVVTGSRTISNGNEAPTPVTIMQTDELLKTTPSNLSEGLKKLPVFGNSGGASRTINPRANSVGNYLSLRGLGPIRTLILQDGRRVPPTAAEGTVDTNTIPQMLVKRVDVVTGGVSSVYGSDAVAGVVNFVLDNRFNGLVANAQKGISSRGDAASLKIGAAGGTDILGGRGHFEASIEHFEQDGLDSKLDREAGRRVIVVNGLGTQANPFRLYENTRNASFSYGGRVPGGPLANRQFLPGGVLAPFDVGSPTGLTGTSVGGDGIFQNLSSLTPDLKTTQAFARMDYDLDDDWSLFVQGGWAESTQRANYINFILTGVLISRNNPFVSNEVRTALGGAPVFPLLRAYRDVDPLAIKIKTTNWNGTVGIKGALGEAKIDLYYTKSENNQFSQTINNVELGRLAAALDVVLDGNGVPVCRAATVNPTVYGGCIPLNPLGEGSTDPAAIDYVRGTTSYKLITKFDNVGLAISGSPFSSWAGPIQMAVSSEYRKLQLTNKSGALPTEAADCNGPTLNCGPAFVRRWFQGTTENIDVDEEVAEVAVEATVPLLDGASFADSVSLNLAGRYAHYSNSGSAWTWKVGGVWEVNDQMTFRVTRSRDFRAPTLYDLFQPSSAATSIYADQHTGIAGQLVTTLTSGNADLEPEISNTLTIGAVVRPFSGFSLAVDYFDLKLNNAITLVNGLDGLTQVQCENSNGTSPLCDLYVRPLPFSDRSPANFPTAVLASPLNSSSIKTRGVDIEANYSTSIGADAKLSMRGLLTYQPKLEIVQFEGAPVVDGAGAATDVAKWRASLSANLSWSNWNLTILERWRASLKQSGNPTLYYEIPNVPSVAYTDININFQPENTPFQFYLHVENLFDKEAPIFIPPGTSPGFNYPAVSGDDVLGRYITAGVKLTF